MAYKRESCFNARPGISETHISRDLSLVGPLDGMETVHPVLVIYRYKSLSSSMRRFFASGFSLGVTVVVAGLSLDLLGSILV